MYTEFFATNHVDDHVKTRTFVLTRCLAKLKITTRERRKKEAAAANSEAAAPPAMLPDEHVEPVPTPPALTSISHWTPSTYGSGLLTTVGTAADTADTTAAAAGLTADSGSVLSDGQLSNHGPLVTSYLVIPGLITFIGFAYLLL